MVQTRLLRFSHLILVAGLTICALLAPNLASAANCEDLLNVKVGPYISGKGHPSPSGFQRRWKNRFKLWWNRNNLIEIDNIPVRTQCFGTCYLYASQPAIESALKAQGTIGEKDYLINLLPLFKVAQQRYLEREGKSIDFMKLVTSGTYEGFSNSLRKTSFVLDEASLEKVGGAAAISIIERQILDTLVQGAWWKFWDRNRNIEGILNGSEADLVQLIRQRLERALSKKAKQPIRLRVLEIADVKSVVIHEFSSHRGLFFSYTYSRWVGSLQDLNLDLMTKVASAYLKVTGAAAATPEEQAQFQQTDMTKDVLPEILSALAKRRAVSVSIRSLFSQSGGSHGNHAVALMGAVVDPRTNELKGFKYVNSWTSEFGANGYGYITRTELEANFVSMEYITEIDVKEGS